MKYLSCLMCAAVLLLSGCASSLMKPGDEKSISALPEQHARVVFLRPSALGAAIQASVFDVTDGKPGFVGVSSVGTKVVYDTDPGKHRFMVVSEAADFLDANLAAGKTYYAIVAPRMGMWKARFSLWPVKADPKAPYSLAGSEFPGWVQQGKLVLNTPEGEQWAKANAADIQGKYSAYLKVWDAKSPEALEKRALDPEDGVAAK